MPTDDALIVRVLQHYFPDYEPPKDRGKEWVKTLCPFHGESNPSATISFKHDAFKCFACDEKGNAVAIIMRKEEISYRDAIEFATRIAPGSDEQIRGKYARKSRRRVFGSEGASSPERPRQGRQVPPGIRRGPSPWA